MKKHLLPHIIHIIYASFNTSRLFRRRGKMEMHKRVIAFALFVVFTFGFLTDCIAGTSELPNHQGVRSSAPFFNKAGKAIEQLRIGKHEKAWKMISKELKKPSRSSRKDPCYLHAAALQILAKISTMTALRPPDFDQLVQDSYDYIRENCETDAGYLGLAESSYANILGQSGKYGFAIPYFERAEKLAVTDYERAMCMNNIAICYSHMGDFELCDHYQLKSLELLSQYFKTKRKYKDNSFEAVQRISYSNVLESRLSRLRDHILVGTENKKEGLVKMRKIWGEIENINNNKKWVSKGSRFVAYSRAMRIFAFVDKEFARELFVKAEKLSRKYPDKEIAKVDIIGCEALLLQLEGKHQEAIESFKQAIRINPDHANAHYNLGTAYDELGKYEDAIVSYKQALMINPDDASTHYNLGLAYYNLGKYEEAIESYKQAIRIDPDYADAHNNLGFAYQKSGKYQEEIESYKQALKIDPDDASVHNNLGYAYYDSGKYQEAIEAYKQVLRIDPDYVKAHGNLGLAYLKSGKYEEAIESYKQALRIDPDSKYAHKSLGYAYHKRGIYRVLEEEWGFDGHSRINHEYNLKTIEGDKVVVDNATGLMWHQSGSDDKMDWNETLMWIEKLNKGSWLNKGGYAGYHDWRLPTVEEAASLLEPSKKNGLYIAPVFSNKQSYIRSSGRHSSGGTWRVLFYDGRVNGSDIFGGGSYYVRPVRSVE